FSSDNPIRIEEYSMTEMTNYKLTLVIIDFEGLELELSYDTSIFDDAGINRMVRHFENIIINIIENTVCSINQIDMLTEEERQQILIDFNNTKADYPKDKTIHQLFEEQVERTPDNIAVVYEDNSLTYKKLNEKANQLGRVLRDNGVGTDSIVGIMVERSLEMIIGIMGVLKAGGAYLPIDPEYPQDRIEYMLQDSGAAILLTQSRIKDKVEFEGQIIELEDEKLYQGNVNNIKSNKKPQNLAYVIYTSGSTGKPEGVMIEDCSVVNFITGMANNIEFTPEKTILAVTTISFDIFGLETLLPLIKGLRIVIADENSQKDVNKLSEMIYRQKVDIIQTTPSRMKLLADISNTKMFNSLKEILIGGESLTESLVQNLRNKTKAKIYNVYGPTETTIWSTVKNLSEGQIDIGKPIANTKVYLVDKYSNLVPVGVVGELCITGEGLARGYLNRPELTTEKFVDNPFESGTRMYKTGDLASWIPDGNIEFIGRIDHQVKIRGYRIEFGEIENRLLSHEVVKEALVLANNSNDGSKYLCAYISADRGMKVSELRECLSKDLPDYMIPSYFIQMEKLPLTPNGKVDRKALPEPNGSISTGTEYEAPRNSTEEKLVTIWREILGIEKIGINDNFFELGGHSLKATSLVAKIHKALSVEIPLRMIFNNPTIKGISEYVKDSEENIYSQIQPVEAKDYYEMSSAQKRIYALQQFELNSTSYNMPRALELEGELDIEWLKEVFNKLIQRHEALRTSFEVEEEALIQKVQKKVKFEIEEYKAEDKKIE
ncbi:MAG: amino acid adenylation domain-containing protein, partial [Lutisporaceae bacterium]